MAGGDNRQPVQSDVIAVIQVHVPEGRVQQGQVRDNQIGRPLQFHQAAPSVVKLTRLVIGPPMLALSIDCSVVSYGEREIGLVTEG
jgi:hypothetical protein